MPGDSRQAHLKRRSQLINRGVAYGETRQDRAPGGVRQRRKGRVQMRGVIDRYNLTDVLIKASIK